jgi:CCR4-NOT transcription complex subunit 7/8
MSMKKLNRSKEKKESTIRDVYADNFIEEIKRLSFLISKYNHVAMDTEFPGVVYQSSINTREVYYRTIKANVDKLKLIQVGVTISDEWGNHPQEGSTWQFNLKFDLNSDQYSSESIALLTNSGINFELLANRGIPHELFGEYLTTSGLLLNEDIHWVSFHGIYDFAYFLRVVTNLPLPETENGFFDALRLYFNNFYDIRFLVRFNENFRGSLAKLGTELNIPRVGTQHQAGSDSLITSAIYFKLKKEYLTEDATRTDRNVLFGIGFGLEDTESMTYNSTYFVNNSYKVQNGTSNSASNFGYEFPQFYNGQNLLNMQYSFLRNTPNYYNSMNNMNMAYNYGYNQYNAIPSIYNLNSVSSNNLSEETKKKYNLKGAVED